MLVLKPYIKLTSFISPGFKSEIKNLWGYVAIAFNRVDETRLKQVGPDRLCAEWILKNGGAVAFSPLSDKYLRDYNSLPPQNIKLNIKCIDASNASIMKIGFEHLKNCNHIEKIILHECKHLEEDGLEGLLNVKDTLKHLQVSGCYNITDNGLIILENLTNLQTLKIFDMKYVSDLNAVIKTLEKRLNKCKFLRE